MHTSLAIETTEIQLSLTIFNKCKFWGHLKCSTIWIWTYCYC